MDETRVARSDDAFGAALGRLPEGELLGDFRILKVLGRGGMGVVYLAHQLSLDRTVALKVLPLLAALDPTRLERFLREGEVLARLSHPAIVPVYSAGEIEGTLYYAMAHVPGCSLAELGPPAPAEIGPRVRMVATIAEALAEAHRQGVIHRDVKPGNILLHEDGRVFLTDFGLARILGDESLSRSGDVLGTPAYLSPEQAAGKRSEVGARSDIYSLGAVLYQLVVGRPPFAGEDSGDILRQILTREPDLPRRHASWIHRDLETIILRAMAPEPQGRYSSCELLAEDLNAFLEHRPIRARRSGVLVRSLRWSRRRPAAAALAALLTVFLPVLTFLWLSNAWQAAELAEVERTKRRAEVQQLIQESYVAVQECTPGRHERGIQRAVELTTRCLELDPTCAQALLLRALARRDLGGKNLDLALADLDHLHRSTRGPGYLRAQILDVLGRTEESREQLERSANLPSEDAFDLLLEAGVLYTRKRCDEALQTIGRAIAMEPRNPRLLHLRLGILEGLGRYQEALLDANACRHLVWEEDWPRLHMSHLYQMSKQPERALAILDEELALEPRHGFATLRRSFVLVEMGRDEEAEATCRKALDLDLDARWRSLAHIQIGQLLEKRGAWREAIEQYRVARDLDAGDNRYRISHGAVLFLQHGDTEGALSYLHEVIDPGVAADEIPAVMGWALKDLGRKEEALDYLEAAAAAVPGRWRIRYQCAEILDGLGREQEAWQVIRALLRDNPRYYYAHTWAAWKYSLSGAWADVVTHSLAAIEIDPRGYPDPYRTLVLALRREGRLGAALVYGLRANALFPGNAKQVASLVAVLRDLVLHLGWEALGLLAY